MSKLSKEIRSLDNKQIQDRLAELDMQKIKNTCQVATGTSQKASGLVRNTKKTIARLLTEQRARELKKLTESKKV